MSRRSRLLCALLALVTLAAGLPTFFVDDLLQGPEVMNGSARGTALVAVVIAVPLLTWGVTAASRGSVRGRAAMVGALAYLTYNAVLFCLATPFNALFLLYVAMLGLAVWSLIMTLLDVPSPRPVSDRLPARPIAAVLGLIGALNAAVWLRVVIPDLSRAQDPAHLAGTGLTVNPIYIQDLAIWVPAVILTSVLLWRRRPWGGFLAGAALVFWVVEAVGVAIDQWFGSASDPTTDVASTAGALIFVVLACIAAVPLVLWLRHPEAAEGERSARDEVA